MNATATATKPKRKTKSKPSKPKAGTKGVSGETLFVKAVVAIGVKSIDRHPDNRTPKQSAIDEVAESINQHGQLEPCLVRQVGRRYQLISGETRWLAQQQLGNKFVDCRVGHDIDDALALKLVAVANGARNDLDAIERAQLLLKLTASIDDGGSGMTQDEAGECMGMSRSGVSNSIRLLSLPDKIKSLIAAGDFPATYAREALSSFENEVTAEIAAATIFEAVNHPDGICSRSEFMDSLEWEIKEKTYSMKPNTKPSDFDLRSSCTNWAGRIFKPSKEQKEQLGVITIGKEDRATNVALWKELQKAAVAKIRDGGKVEGSDKSDKKPKLTPAQQKAKDEKQADQMKRRVERWKQLWKRWWLHYEISTEAALRVLLSYESQTDFNCGVDDVLHSILDQLKITKPKGAFDVHKLMIAFQQSLSGDTAAGDLDYVINRIAKEILWPKDRDDLVTFVMDDLVNDTAAGHNFDPDDAWNALLDSGNDDAIALLAEFYSMFSKDMLSDLATGVVSESTELQDAKSKDQYVAALSTSFVAMPPVLLDKKKAKKKSKAKRGAS